MANEATKRKQDWIKRNPEKQKAIQRRYREKYREVIRSKQYIAKYGISLEEYDRLAEDQGYLCKICGEPETTKHSVKHQPRNLAIDHNHVTGEVRGLLCQSCNTGLGKFKEDKNLLEKAIDYLKETNE